MIKNQRQYRITRTQARAFESALAELTPASADPNDIAKYELLRTAMEEQLRELREQLRDYDTLQASPGVFDLDSLDQLPRTLIRARIAARLSQSELAKQLGIKEQQIQRYEATEYDGVSLNRLLEISRALGLESRQQLRLPARSTALGPIFKKLAAIGLKQDFIEQRLWKSVAPDLEPSAATPEHISAFLDLLGRMFHWSSAQIFSTDPLPLDQSILAGTAFKRSARQAATPANAYTVYAHYVAMLVLQCTDPPAVQERETHPRQIHAALFEGNAPPNFEAVLLFLWNAGLPVIPLGDSGAFHGAWWRSEGRDVAVIKQESVSLERWTIDALHEYRHALRAEDSASGAMIEDRDQLEGKSNDPDEAEATWFAVLAVLGESPSMLADACVSKARGKIEWLKAAVPDVAARHSVWTGFLANYLAFRLQSANGINWWPTAQQFQTRQPHPRSAAADFLRPRLDLSRLAPPDRNLLDQALFGENHE